MGAANTYLQNIVPSLYRKQALDIMIFFFIDAQRSLVPGISVENSALAFLKRYDIPEEQLTVKKISQTYFRIQKENIDESRTKGSEAPRT